MSAPSKRERNRRARRRGILDAALAVFAAEGYAGASMEAIARAAGVSKPTLYLYFDTKEQLFIAVMEAKRDEMLDALTLPGAGGMVETLHRFAWQYADTVLRPDMLSLARLVIAEAQRQPEIGRSYQAAGPDRLLDGMMGWLKAQRQAGQLVFDDAELAAQDLWGLILSAPRTTALHRPDAIPDRAEVARYVENGLAVFLKAYAAAPADALERLKRLRCGTTPGGRR